MKELNTPIKTKAKKLLAAILALQIIGFAPLSYAGKGETVNVQPNPSDMSGGSGEGKNPVTGYVPDGTQIDHGAPIVPAPPKKFCRHPDGRWKGACILVGILIGVAIIIAIVNASKKKSAPKGGGGGGGKPTKTEKPKPEEPNGPPPPAPPPPVVPCCNTPAPAPAPEGGGLIETSTVETGNQPIEGVEPVIVNP